MEDLKHVGAYKHNQTVMNKFKSNKFFM